MTHKSSSGKVDVSTLTSIELAPEVRAHSHVHTHSHSHADGHSHSHEHSHSHGHQHEHALPEPIASPNSPLERGAGIGRTLLLDAPSGVAGDMTIAALLDLGVPFEVVKGAVERLGLTGFAVRVLPARSGVIGGSRFVVEVTGAQPERNYAAIDLLIERSSLEVDVKRLARRIFRRLAEAESAVHRVPIESVAFHEVGAIDAIVDIVGAAAGFAHLGARVLGTPLPLGRGAVECQHGLLPLPAPATLLCLRGVPTYDSGLEVELVTPTGAAILASVAEEFVTWPTFVPDRVGWGCGTRQLPGGRPNALRAVLGFATAGATEQAAHVVLEVNVDDMTGELAAHAIDALLRAGALDAWASPVTMKKGRPGLVISAVCERPRASSVVAVLLGETSSIGVRQYAVARTERPRRMVEVDTRFGRIPIKVSEGAYGPALAKPEFDACAAAARTAGVSVREVLEAALAAYQAKL
jgi:uncharacterized protein (TIGR00299 family) protein